jgi:hypothetical protein
VLGDRRLRHLVLRHDARNRGDLDIEPGGGFGAAIKRNAFLQDPTPPPLVSKARS